MTPAIAPEAPPAAPHTGRWHSAAHIAALVLSTAAAVQGAFASSDTTTQTLMAGAVVAVLLHTVMHQRRRAENRLQSERLAQALVELGAPRPAPQAPLHLTALTHSAAEARHAVTDAFEQVHTDASALRGDVAKLNQSAHEVAQSAQHNEAQLIGAAQSVMDLSMAIQESSSAVTSVRERADATLQTTRQGESMVDQASLTMNSITESSAQVRGLITTIEGIAFQTSILSLNAAVEAARAGESGKGFAVVAGEVRTLANRTTRAATDVKRVLSQSLDELEVGTVLMKEAGDMMRDTVKAVNALADDLTRLDLAAGTQREQVDTINHSLIELNDVLTRHAQSAQTACEFAERFDGCTQSLLSRARQHLQRCTA